MNRWAARAPQRSLAIVADLCLTADMEAGETHDALWLRGNEPEGLDLRLRQIPGAERYTLTDADELIPAGRKVPTGYLPACDWQPLRALLTLALPTPRRSIAPKPAAVPLRLVRDASQRPATYLMTSLAAWCAWAEAAPLARLSCLTFATCSEGRVLVTGSPLPTIAGAFHWREEQIITPAGWCWSPRVDALTAGQVLGATDDQLVLWRESGDYELLAEADFVAARRAAVRATAEAFDGRC